jgi:hypothetical protein
VPPRGVHLCIAERIRRLPPERLEPAELRMLERENDWQSDNPALAAELYALVGKEVELLEDHRSMGGTLYHANTTFKVVARSLDRLVCRRLYPDSEEAGTTAMLLRRRWIRIRPGKMRTCRRLGCSERFRSVGGQKYCTPDCGTAPCAACGKPFIRHGSKYCLRKSCRKARYMKWIVENPTGAVPAEI